MRQQVLELVDLAGNRVDDLGGPFNEALGQVLRQPAGADERVVHPQAGHELEDVQQVLAVAEAVDHRRQRAELEPAGGESHLVGGDAVDLGEDDPDGRRAFGHLLGDAQQLLHRQAVGKFVEQRGQVVHAGDEGHALDPRPVLGVLLDAGVQVADDRLVVDDDLAVHGQQHAQDAVGRGVLGPHVDDHQVVLDGVGQVLPLAGGDDGEFAVDRGEGVRGTRGGLDLCGLVSPAAAGLVTHRQ